MPDMNSDIYKRLVRHVAPYQIFSHEEQLKRLSFKAKLCLRKIANILVNNVPGEHKSWRERLSQGGEMPCELLPIRPSPSIEGYRNKDDLAIAQGVDGSPDIGLYIPPGKFPHMAVCGYKLQMQKEKHHHIVQCFRNVVMKSHIPAHGISKWPGGHWRSLLIRTNRQDDTIVSVSVNPRNHDESFPLRAQDIVHEYFVHGEGASLGIDSVFFSQVEGYRNYRHMKPVTSHLHGPTHIVESLHGRQFRISPESFFQINTGAAEILYTTIKELAALSTNTVLLDICCGTGTIGILCSKDVHKVLAIEEVAAAIEDAHFNAEINGCNNIEFFCGSAERLLRQVLEMHTKPGDDIVAVVNPGRGGLGKKVTRALRHCEAIKRIVYASCNPEGRAAFNFVELCRQQDIHHHGDPFVPTCAVPVDMFPTTKHVELVVLLQR